MKDFLKAGLVAFLALGLGTAAHAATINVTTVADEADGSCADGDCSLRDAVSSALPGDTVSVPAGTYVLTLGRIYINKSLTLTGAAARSTIIDGNAASQVFEVGTFIGQSEIVQISDLTIRNGRVSSFGRGGGIRNVAILTLTRCIVTNNRAYNGAGIINEGGANLTIRESAIVGNQTTGNAGGGIGNGGSLTLVNSTVSGNTALKSGGSGGGGGLLNVGGRGDTATFTAVNSTIAFNIADPGNGGGILNDSAQVSLVNTIISGNTGGDCVSANSPQTSDHNLDGDGSCGLTGPGDLPGTNPLLGPLADNGGPTDTHALLAGSPAIDTATGAGCPAIDQRGVTRPQGPQCDIGAFELESNNAPPTCSEATASPAGIWPPNHAMVQVSIQGVTDPDGDAVDIEIDQVHQDEPTNGTGDGNTCPDAQGLGTATASVRAERRGQGNGRVYTLFFTATDEQGATCQGSVQVCVPHSSQGSCVDDGPLFDSTVCSGSSTSQSTASSAHSHKSITSGLSLPCGSHFPTPECDLQCDASVLLCH